MLTSNNNNNIKIHVNIPAPISQNKIANVLMVLVNITPLPEVPSEILLILSI
jgi:hypothetical protein